MALDVVRVRVAAGLVVGDQHVRAELPDQGDQRGGRLLEIDQREAARGQGWLRIALGQPGVDEAQPAVLHAEDLRGPGHLGAPDGRHVGQHVGPVHGRVQDAAGLAPGTGDDHDLLALGDVAGAGGGALAGLVVGVRVHAHQPQRGGAGRVGGGHRVGRGPSGSGARVGMLAES